VRATICGGAVTHAADGVAATALEGVR